MTQIVMTQKVVVMVMILSNMRCHDFLHFYRFFTNLFHDNTPKKCSQTMPILLIFHKYNMLVSVWHCNSYVSLLTRIFSIFKRFLCYVQIVTNICNSMLNMHSLCFIPHSFHVVHTVVHTLHFFVMGVELVWNPWNPQGMGGECKVLPHGNLRHSNLSWNYIFNEKELNNCGRTSVQPCRRYYRSNTGDCRAISSRNNRRKYASTSRSPNSRNGIGRNSQHYEKQTLTTCRSPSKKSTRI